MLQDFFFLSRNHSRFVFSAAVRCLKVLFPGCVCVTGDGKKVDLKHLAENCRQKKEFLLLLGVWIRKAGLKLSSCSKLRLSLAEYFPYGLCHRETSLNSLICYWTKSHELKYKNINNLPNLIKNIFSQQKFTCTHTQTLTHKRNHFKPLSHTCLYQQRFITQNIVIRIPVIVWLMKNPVSFSS